MNPYVELIIHNLLPVMSGLLLILVPFFVKWLMGFVEKKFHIQLSADKEQKLDDILDSGIAHAEEWANSKVVAKETVPAGVDKLAKAAAFVSDEITRYGLDKLAEQKIKDLLTAKLGQQRVADPTPAPVTTPAKA